MRKRVLTARRTARRPPADVPWLESALWIDPAENSPRWLRPQQAADIFSEYRELEPASAYRVPMPMHDPPPGEVKGVLPRSCRPLGIACLRGTRGPVHVPVSVGAVVVFPVQGLTWRSGADHALDVFDEMRQVMPSGADFNPPAAITAVTLAARVVAPCHHLAPGAVKRMTGQAVLPGCSPKRSRPCPAF